MAGTCRNQGIPLPERACGYHHEGTCDADSFVVLRRRDVAALEEEWADLTLDPFWKPLADVTVIEEGVTYGPRQLDYGDVVEVGGMHFRVVGLEGVRANLDPIDTTKRGL